MRGLLLAPLRPVLLHAGGCGRTALQDGDRLIQPISFRDKDAQNIVRAFGHAWKIIARIVLNRDLSLLSINGIRELGWPTPVAQNLPRCFSPVVWRLFALQRSGRPIRRALAE